jgi:hypothetical protein
MAPRLHIQAHRHARPPGRSHCTWLASNRSTTSPEATRIPLGILSAHAADSISVWSNTVVVPRGCVRDGSTPNSLPPASNAAAVANPHPSESATSGADPTTPGLCPERPARGSLLRRCLPFGRPDQAPPETACLPAASQPACASRSLRGTCPPDARRRPSQSERPSFASRFSGLKANPIRVDRPAWRMHSLTF